MILEQNVIDKLLDQLKKDQIKRVVVGAVIFNQNLEVLLVRRASTEKFMAGIWEIPSGKVARRENILDGLARETEEETGLTLASIDAYLGFFDYNSNSGTPTRQLNFLVSTDHFDVKIEPKEHDLFMWAACDNSKKLENLKITATPDILKAKKILSLKSKI
jgi:8-oxo-dGTP diphosphatase